MNLPISLALSVEIPDVEADGLTHRALRRLFDLPVAQRLQRHLALDHLLLEHLGERGQARLALGVELDLLVFQLDRAAGVLEVVARGDLARRLVDRVADLLHVELGHDVEGGHGSSPGVGALGVRNWRPDTVRAPGSVPEWPKGAGCKPAAQATLVRIQPGPLTPRSPARRRRAFRFSDHPASEHALHLDDVEPAGRTCGRPPARCPRSRSRRPRAAGSRRRSRR